MNYLIDHKGKVMLGGMLQTIHVWSNDPSNRILLWLHGGPGVPNRHNIRVQHLDLLDSFTLVAWDQRGCGGSYAGCDPATLTLEQLISDAKELVELLCELFEKDKVFILGGSWGTELGTFLAARYPEHIAAYVGYGQVVNGIENERRSFDFALKAAINAGNELDVAELMRVGPPVYGQYHPVLEGLLKQRSILARYGGHTAGKKESFLRDTVKPILASPEYNIGELRGIVKGYKFVLSHMWPQIVDYDFKNDVHHFEMPYYIFQGRHDHTTPASLVQDYYDAISAPSKDLIWFEDSAHGVFSEEPKKAKRLLREKLLAVEG